MIKKALQWHPAFQAVLQIELSEDSDCLEFLKEYQLSEKPLQMDTLIVKRKQGAAITKSIGKMFKMYNVIEYKSPEDYLSVNDFYKVVGYACIYQSDTERVAQIPPEELTITLVSSRYPRELIRHLKGQYEAGIEMEYPGIYYVTGLIFPLQLVIAGKLPEDEYIWLSRLRKNLSVDKDIERLALAYKGKDKNPLYSAAMDLIIRANREQYEEGMKMCEALRELFEQELKEREAQGLEQGLEKGLEQGLKRGIGKGKADGILELLSDIGTVPESLRDTVMAQSSQEQLSAWLKLAARADSVEEFMRKIG